MCRRLYGLYWIFLMIGAVVMVAGCTGGAPNPPAPVDTSPPAIATAPAGETSDAADAQDNSLRVAVGSLPDVLDPYQVKDSTAAYLLMTMYDTPLYVDKNGDLLSLVADSVQIGPDHTEYTMTLHSGVTFSDGAQLDASSVVAAWQRGVDLQQDVWLVAQNVEALDSSTVKVTLAEPSDSFLLKAAPRWLIVKETTGPDGNPTLVGSGRYTVKSQSADSLVLAPNSAYWRGADSGLGDIFLQPTGDPQAALLALQKGDANLAFGISKQALTGMNLQESGVSAVQPAQISFATCTVADSMLDAFGPEATGALQGAFDAGKYLGTDALAASTAARIGNLDYMQPGDQLTGEFVLDPNKFDPGASIDTLNAAGYDPDIPLELGYVSENEQGAAFCGEVVNEINAAGINATMAEQVLPAGVADLLKVSDETTIIEQPYEAIGTAYNLISVGGLTDPMAELVTALAEDCQSCGGGFGPGGPPPPPPPFPPGPIPPRLELTIPQQ